MTMDRSFKKLRLTKLFLSLIIAFFILTAANTAKAQQRENFLVDKIYNYADILVVEYFYDTNNKLIKINIPGNLGDRRQEWAAYTADFEYIDERVSIIKHRDVSYNMFNYDTHVFYDMEGQLIKSEEREDGYLITPPKDYRYENGRVIGHTNDPIYTDTIVYDNSGNVIEHIYIRPELNDWGTPIPGTTKRVVYTYEYDDKLKPNFGLDYLFVFQPLPHMGTETGFARELSNNNLTEFVNSGSTWTYTYNEYGLPETIETKWKDVTTIDPDTGEPFPMLLKIKYKQIEGSRISKVTKEIADINIFPNPAKDKFIIDYDNSCTISLYDMLGKKVFNQSINGKSEINISHLPKGIYNILIISKGEVIKSSKIVKQ